MKNLLIAALVVSMAVPAYSEVTGTAQTINPVVVADMNKPIDNKISTGSWIWIGVLVLVGAVAGTIAYNTKQPI